MLRHNHGRRAKATTKLIKELDATNRLSTQSYEAKHAFHGRDDFADDGVNKHELILFHEDAITRQNLIIARRYAMCGRRVPIELQDHRRPVRLRTRDPDVLGGNG